MVFHRFLSGPRAVSLRINDQQVVGWDPFLADHPASQPLPVEHLPFAGGRVTVSPHVLPHISRLTAQEHRLAAGPRGWNAHQGFYVYRARRLLVAGDWLGLAVYSRRSTTSSRGSRSTWTTRWTSPWQIDVRKATARIPGPLRDPLRRIAETTRQRASEAYRFRGKTVARSSDDGAIRFVWRRVQGRDGAVSYRINRDHPLIAGALSRTPARAAAASSTS